MKFKIKTNLVTGIVMGLLSIFLLVVMPKQVRVPAFDSGAPSPRIIPGVCIVIMLVCSVILVIQSLVFKKSLNLTGRTKNLQFFSLPCSAFMSF